MLKILENETKMDGGILVVTIESDREPGPEAVEEVQSPEVRKMAIEAAQGKLSRPGINHSTYFPVDANGKVVDGINHQGPVFRYRAQVRVANGTL